MKKEEIKKRILELLEEDQEAYFKHYLKKSYLANRIIAKHGEIVVALVELETEKKIIKFMAECGGVAYKLK